MAAQVPLLPRNRHPRRVSCGGICHLGTDVIAHSFVNEQAGGPFRTHWQRHHLVENHIDAWNYRQAGAGGTLVPDDLAATEVYPDLGRSAFVYAVALDDEYPNGWERRRFGGSAAAPTAGEWR
jgi:hypothetical protein